MSMTSTNPDCQTLAIKATDENTLKKVTTWDELKNISEQKNVAPYIKATSGNYYSIDVSVAMKDLTCVGSLLQAAFAGTKGFKSNAEVAVILANYATLIKSSNVTSATFVEACLLAIKYHRMVLVVAEKKGLEKALKVYTKCTEVALKMAQESEKLVKKAEGLVELTIKALKSTCEDEVQVTDHKKKVEEMIGQLEARKKRLGASTKALQEAVEEERQNELNARARADKADERAFTMGIVSAIASPLMGIAGKVGEMAINSQPQFAAANLVGSIVSNNANDGQNADADACVDTTKTLVDSFSALATERSKKQDETDEAKKEIDKLKEELENSKDDAEKKRLEEEIERKTSFITQITQEGEAFARALAEQSNKQEKVATTARGAEMQLAAQRAALQKELREQNADLQESLSLLSSSHKEKNWVEQAIAALEVSVKTLGRVITIFGNTKQFWEGVEKHCKSLASMEGTATDWAELEMKEEFITEIKESALCWISLGNITRTAAVAMADVDKGVDQIMNDLPTREESNKLLDTLTSGMLQDLETERLMLEA